MVSWQARLQTVLSRLQGMVKEENTRAQVKSKSVVVWMGPVQLVLGLLDQIRDDSPAAQAVQRQLGFCI